MSETLGGDFVYQTLAADTAVKAITTAIYNARMVPATEDSLTTVNAYHAGVFDARLEYFQSQWSVDCRAPTGDGSLQLSLAVKDALNRTLATVSGKRYFAVVQVGSTIPPANEADVFNTPVSVTIRRK